MKFKILILILIGFFECLSKSYINIQDSLELIKIYQVLDGSNWRFNKGWDGSLPVNQWFGITVDTIKNGNDEIYFVSKINLQSNKLSGELPILNLSELEVLNLAGNKISGNIPELNLPKLRVLYLSGNQLSGTIPEFYFLNIEVIDLSGNNLSGEVKNFNFEKLKLLNLSNNNLTGEIPLIECPNLESLYLRNNNFEKGIGNIHSEQIKILDISNNKLEETITSLSYSKLQILNLSRNRLKLGNSQFNLPEVERINLSFNNISGIISDLNCPKLKSLILNNNSIMDFGLKTTINIEEINLSKNNLVELKDLSSFEKLYELNVSNNKLSFEDLESNISILNFDYSEQDTLLPVMIGRNGNSFTLRVVANGDSNLYQWEFNGEILEGETQNILTGNENGSYRCIVNNKLVEDLTLYSKIVNPKKVIYALKSDSLALVEFYNATNGDDWESSRNWLSENLILHWEGIETDTIFSDKDSFLVVSGIHLGNNNLSGSLPELNFRYLKELILYSNNLSGTIEQINLPELTDLDLSGNNFDGELPKLNTPKLKTLDMSYNSFSGEIPNYNLPELEFIDLSHNFLSGEIPNFNFPKLDQMVLSKNELTGEIPKFNFSLMTSLELNDNDLLGGFPAINSADLFSIDISNNKIVDLPDLRYLKSLDFLIVSSNKLTFEDLEKNKNISNFDYYEQDTILPVKVRYDNGNIIIKVIAGGNANKYQWQNFGNDMFGQNADSIIVPYKTGEYRCKVDNIIINDMTYYSVKVNPELISVSEKDYNEGYIEVYPNPASDYVNICFKMINDRPNLIKIVDALGQLYVFEVHFDKDLFTLDILNLSSGRYVLILEGLHSILRKELLIIR